jgi:hypothetical protein
MKNSIIPIALLLLVSACSPPKIPDVKGQDVVTAQSALEKYGFKVSVTELEDPKNKSGTVIGVEPAINTPNDLANPVKLIVAKAPTFQIKGIFELIDSDLSISGTYCEGKGGYSDIRSYMPVTIRDENNTILASGETGSGMTPEGRFSRIVCKFDFKVGSIPTAKFYIVQIGRRGGITYSFDQMQKNNWEVALKISSR